MKKNTVNTVVWIKRKKRHGHNGNTLGDVQ